MKPKPVVRPIRTIAIASGKGGVGKTQLCFNLGLALVERGRDVLLLDADLALGKLALAGGLRPERTLADVLEGRAGVQDILLRIPGGPAILPAASGFQPSCSAGPHQQAALIQGLSDLHELPQVMLVDCASGLTDFSLNCMAASQEVLLVITSEEASIADAFALIRLLSATRSVFRFRVVANGVRAAQEAQEAVERLNRYCEEFLDATLYYMGYVPQDDQFRNAAQHQTSVLARSPHSRSAQAIRSLAEKIDQLPIRSVPSGNLEFFVESLVQSRD